jgi:hypothetical protein
MSIERYLRWDDPDFDPDIGGFEELERPRDGMVDTAKAELREFFNDEPKQVFYKRQLQVMFEKPFFHWITDRALTELAAEGHIAAETEEVPVIEHMTFYRARTHRFWKRQAAEIRRLVELFSNPDFTKALGAQGEQMFDAALPRFGFHANSGKRGSYGGKTWTETGHDLDRVFERDGIAYGAEIKNTLKYVPSEEFAAKLKMCKFLGLRPLFIVRFAPKSYNYKVWEQGGFSLIFKYQLYPLGQKALADEVKRILRLPVDCPTRIHDGTVQRLLKWHQRIVKRKGEEAGGGGEVV